jgi:hypothetical protein
MKYAHLTVEIRLVGHGVQVDFINLTLATPDGNAIIRRTEVWDFSDHRPVTERVNEMTEAIYQALRCADF